MSLRDECEGNEGSAIMSCGVGACMGSGEVSESFFSRLAGVIQVLLEDLPYSFSFFFKFFFNKFFPLVGPLR